MRFTFNDDINISTERLSRYINGNAFPTMKLDILQLCWTHRYKMFSKHPKPWISATKYNTLNILDITTCTRFNIIIIRIIVIIIKLILQLLLLYFSSPLMLLHSIQINNWLVSFKDVLRFLIWLPVSELKIFIICWKFNEAVETPEFLHFCVQWIVVFETFYFVPD